MNGLQLLSLESRSDDDVGRAPSSSPPSATKPPKRAWLWPLSRILLIAAAGGAAWFIATNWERWIGEARSQRTDDAFLTGDLTPLAAKVSGYVASVAVQDFATVRQGDVLVEIDPSDYRAQLVQVEAIRSAAMAALANLANQKAVQRALIRQASASIDAAAADAGRSHLEADRQRLLLIGHVAGTPQAVERAEADEKRFAAQLLLNTAVLDQQKAILDSFDVQEEQLAAQRDAAGAQVELAANNLRHTQIRAPADGMVGQRQVRPGQFVNVGTQVALVMPMPNIWVIANYKETQMTHILGQHIAGGTAFTMERLAAYASRLGAHVSDAGLVSVQAHHLLAAAVAGQANVLAYRNGFLAAAIGAGVCLLLVALMRPGKPSPF